MLTQPFLPPNGSSADLGLCLCPGTCGQRGLVTLGDTCSVAAQGTDTHIQIRIACLFHTDLGIFLSCLPSQFMAVSISLSKVLQIKCTSWKISVFKKILINLFLYCRFLLVIYFIHISVYMSIPTSHFIPPPPTPGKYQFKVLSSLLPLSYSHCEQAL